MISTTNSQLARGRAILIMNSDQHLVRRLLCLQRPGLLSARRWACVHCLSCRIKCTAWHVELPARRLISQVLRQKTDQWENPEFHLIRTGFWLQKKQTVRLRSGGTKIWNCVCRPVHVCFSLNTLCSILQSSFLSSKTYFSINSMSSSNMQLFQF